MPTRIWQWGLSGAVLVLLGLGLSAAQGTPLIAFGAPNAVPTALMDDQSPNSISAAAMVGVVATPGAAGTPGVYTVLQSDSAGHLAVAGNTPLPTWTAVAVQAVQPNGAVAAQTPLAVAMAGQQVQAATTVVIPAQTPVPYSIGDVVTASTPVALAFANACRANGTSGYIVGGQLATDQSTNAASYRLKLYQSAPPTLVADNAANTVLYANNAIRIGQLDFPAASTGTGSNTAATTFVFDSRIPFNCAAGATTINGILETLSAFTPASGQGYYISLQIARD